MKFSLKFKIGFVLIFLIFLLINFFGFSRPIRNFFYFIATPIQKVLWQGGEAITNFFDVFLEIRGLEKEKELCQLEKEKLLSEAVLAENLKEENKTLREALNINLREEFKLVFAEVIGLDAKTDTLFIDKGKADGLSEELAVITGSRVLVGRVSEVYSRRAKVMILSHKENFLPARVFQKQTSGIIRGKAGPILSFENLPRGEKISEGDIVVSIPLMEIYPDGLLIGEVLQVKSSDIDPFQTAQVLPFFDINKISHLFVIKEF